MFIFSIENKDLTVQLQREIEKKISQYFLFSHPKIFQRRKELKESEIYTTGM